jgi:hypothetical protein
MMEIVTKTIYAEEWSSGLLMTRAPINEKGT